LSEYNPTCAPAGVRLEAKSTQLEILIEEAKYLIGQLQKHYQAMTEHRTQLEIIIAILEREGRIDNFRCIHERISLRLGARIWDLRQREYEFRTEERPDKNTVYQAPAKLAPKQLA
jgi:hypothetical protein